MAESEEAALAYSSAAAVPGPRSASDGVAAADGQRSRTTFQDNIVSRAHDPRSTVLPRVRAWMLVPAVDAVLLMVPALWHPDHVRASLVMSGLFLLFLSDAGRYRARLHLSVLDELPTLLSKLLIAGAIVATVIALRHEQRTVAAFLVDVVVAVGLVVAGRVVITQLILWSRRRRITTHPTILIGVGPLAADLAHIIAANPRYGLDVIGFVDELPGSRALEPWLGRPADLSSIVRATGADVLLVADGAFAEAGLMDVVRAPACLLCDLLVVPRFPHLRTQTGLADHIGSIPIMRIRTPRLSGIVWGIKRLFDVVVGGVLLVVFGALMAACAIAVRLEGGSGVIFRQRRVGRNGEQFDCLKFRTLRPLDSADSETTWSIADDQRVGRIGRLLRHTSLDELPQLWNVVRGDMTLVGPRPERPYFVEQFAATYDRYAERHRVKAGLTGFAQVHGLRGNTSIADRARFDNYYIENWSLWLDLKIFVRTLSQVLFARGR